MKQQWFKWLVMMFTLISLIQDHLILTFPHPLPSKDVLILYYTEGCPYANEVIEWIREWMFDLPNLELKTTQSTAQFPSPTLRIPFEDFYINYVGSKAIKEAIKTTIFK